MMSFGTDAWKHSRFQLYSVQDVFRLQSYAFFCNYFLLLLCFFRKSLRQSPKNATNGAEGPVSCRFFIVGMREDGDAVMGL
jgi:hypothetical protein